MYISIKILLFWTYYFPMRIYDPDRDDQLCEQKLYSSFSCMSHVSWESRSVDLGRCRDNVNLVLEANDLYRYYQNVCTPGQVSVVVNQNTCHAHLPHDRY